MANFKRVYDNIPEDLRDEINDYKTLKASPGWIRIRKKLTNDIINLNDEIMSMIPSQEDYTPEKAVAFLIKETLAKEKHNYMKQLVQTPDLCIDKAMESVVDTVPKTKKRAYD